MSNIVKFVEYGCLDSYEIWESVEEYVTFKIFESYESPEDPPILAIDAVWEEFGKEEIDLLDCAENMDEAIKLMEKYVIEYQEEKYGERSGV